MIKAVVCFNDILLQQFWLTKKTFHVGRVEQSETQHLQEFGVGLRNETQPTVLKNDRLVTFWWGWFTGIAILGSAAPVFAVQSEANGQTADIRPPIATTQVDTTTVFPASAMLISQAVNLQLGDSGPAVTDLQNRLRARGYNRVRADGDFGPQTEAAVRQFQQSQRLDVDGIVGPATDSALRRSSPTSTGLNSGSSVQQGRFSIFELQRRLKSRGFYQGEIDGVIGTETRAAIRAAQETYGLTERDILNGGL
jgi:peptidoglycan hydrolase-like protein with peptidoglycan-binding domain